MAIYASLTLCTVASLFVGGAAFREQQSGTTSGSAGGKNVEPSTATQKSMIATNSGPRGRRSRRRRARC